MDGFGSECSSGCESGWTMYLDSPNPSQMNGGLVGDEEYRAKKCIQEDDDEEEDLSMVSDASSGPPPYSSCQESDEENGCYNTSPSTALANRKNYNNKRQKIKTPSKKQLQYHHSLLDDTASSPIFSSPKGNFHSTNRPHSRETVLDFSQGFCTTPSNELYTFRNHPDFLQSSMPAKSSSAKPVTNRKLQERKWQQDMVILCISSNVVH